MAVQMQNPGWQAGVLEKRQSWQIDKCKVSKKPRRGQQSRIDFEALNRGAIVALPSLLARWLPDGRRQGHEWVARNPKRVDKHPGSFRINIVTGRWADFALVGVRGGDAISLLAYLEGLSQIEAARHLAATLGVQP